jgi:protein-S-isoprenylcysteine O-methyltransferase Ste14
MASQRRNAIVSILFVVFGGPGIGLVYLPLWMTRFRVPQDEPAWQMALGTALIVVGLVSLLESVVRFVHVGRGTLVPTTPTERLVVSGLYCYVRDPMYMGVLTCVAGETPLFSGLAFICSCTSMRSRLPSAATESNMQFTNATFRAGCRG